MKVRLGGRDVQPSRIEESIEKSLRGAMTAASIRLSQDKIQRLANQVKVVAEAEAEQLIPTIIEIMDNDVRSSKQGVSYDDLIRGATMIPGFTPPGFVSHGTLAWADLSLDYVKHKARRYPDRRYRFFEYSGRLRAYFSVYGQSVVRNRLGGVEVDVTIPDIKGEKSYPRVTSGPETDNPFYSNLGYTNILLGSIQVRIFPKIARSLLPMMSGNSWSDVIGASGQFEAEIFEGAERVVEKLVNKNNPYRPLVLPAVQFWMQVRIPMAIYGVLKRFISRAHLK